MPRPGLKSLEFYGSVPQMEIAFYLAVYVG
jgi:hypothetical protein